MLQDAFDRGNRHEVSVKSMASLNSASNDSVGVLRGDDDEIDEWSGEPTNEKSKNVSDRSAGRRF